MPGAGVEGEKWKSWRIIPEGAAVGPLRRNQTPPIDLGQTHVPGTVLSVPTCFLGQ